VFGVHLVSEAERLAYADRDKYIADTDFVALPGGTWDTMLNKPYMRTRAALISFNTSMGTAQPGNLGPVPLASSSTPESGTTHMTIVDRDGNAVVMTTTVESGFGSFHMTQGFILNNQLTDFSATPTDGSGVPIANRVAAGKRPRSSMAPTLVFKTAADGTRGDFYMGHRVAGRQHDHPVRREDAGRRARLEPRCAAGDLDDRLRCRQQRDDERRRRASERRRHEQRRQRSARQPGCARWVTRCRSAHSRVASRR
jgi:hypothetical protein